MKQNKPQRIISLVPSQTELLIDLGLEKQLVGITKFCIHPTHLRKTKTIVGGTKTIKIDRIKELQPDIILCNKEENTKEIVETCKQITQVHVAEIFTYNDSQNLILEYGKIFSCKEKAIQIVNDLNFELNSFQNFIKDQEKKKIAYFIWKNPWMVAANNTFINNILEINKFDNIYKNEQRYPEINIEKLKEVKDLDAILLSSEPFPFKEKHIKELQKKIPNTKIILVDGELFSWHGSRLLKSFDYFKKLRNSSI